LLDTLVISIQSQLCCCQYCFLFKTIKNEKLSLLVTENPRCLLQHDLILEQMKHRLHESKLVKTSERRNLSTFWVVLISLTGSLAACRVVWILLTEHLQLHCTFDPILAVDIARVVTHIVLCIALTCLRSKPFGTGVEDETIATRCSILSAIHPPLFLP
jgi:hypothetical protein